ncbi:MAG: outer membrane lipoprotein chaperone LolA [Pseudomonadota bacterium]
MSWAQPSSDDVTGKDADGGAVDLSNAMEQVQHLQGRFEQQQFDESGELLQESSGRFMLLRPAYFSWDITSPDSQLIIADPEYLWHHDRDLETVTRRPIATAQAAAPLQVLSGDMEALSTRYQVSNIGVDRFTLIPLQADAGFEELTVQLKEGLMESMSILDTLGQRIEVQFLDVDSDATLTPKDFAFSPPTEADLFYYDE